MQQAAMLTKKKAFKEAEQLYTRVSDIVSSFSPANGPMIDVINRKYIWILWKLSFRKLELFFLSNRKEDVLKTIDIMKKNVDSRGDKEESMIERLEFANILMHMGNIGESGKICREVPKFYNFHF